MEITWFKRLLLALPFLAATQGWCADLHGRSSTQVLFFDDYYHGRQVELGQYLRVSVTNIDEAGKFSIYGYGRGNLDLNNGDGLTGRLYYLYGDVRDIYDKLDVRVGRQFVNYVAGSAIIDGGEFTVKNIGPVGFSAFGGRDVVFGTKGGELSKTGDYAVGASAFLVGFPKTDLEVSWFRKWDQSDVSRDVVGAMLRQYLFAKVKVYGNIRYDLTSEVVSEALAGAKLFITPSMVFTGEWFQSYPTFDTTSIYSVFAVNRYQEGVFRLDYTVNNTVAIYAGYSGHSYGDDGDATVYQLGLKLHPIKDLLIDVSYDKRNGYGGDMDGRSLDILWDVNKKVQLAGGIQYDIYDRQFFPDGSNEEIVQKYWLAGKYRLAKNMATSVRIENDINKYYSNNVQGRFIFDYDF